MPKTDTTVADTTDSQTADEPLLTVTDVAERLRLSPWATRKLIEDKKIPSVYLGPKTLRVKPAELRAYIDGLPTERPEPANSLTA